MMKMEYKIIADIIEKNSSVLDVGCDDGTLMESFGVRESIFMKQSHFLKKALIFVQPLLYWIPVAMSLMG